MARESQILALPAMSSGNAARRRKRGDLRLIIAGVELNHMFPEIEAHFAQE